MFCSIIAIGTKGIAPMIKTILVPSTGSDADAVAFAAAGSIARLFDAHVEALHVRLDPVELAVAMSTEGSGGPLLEGIIDHLSRDADDAEARARTGFTEFCQKASLPLVTSPDGQGTGASAQFRVETGQEARWIAAYGLTADLAVASRGPAGRDAVQRTTLEALLLETGRPLLIPGPATPSPAFADHVTIAWKPTAQTARAVAFAMPFLARAGDITVLTVEEEEGRRDNTSRLVEHLRRHGIRSTTERLAPDAAGAAATMLKAATAKGGLLVMGGYGHTRLREWVFGGFTQLVIDHAEVPVLMTH
jgi:nucleotide-binding universal stress UspA family protein